MNKLGTVLIVIGILCVLCAASNDEYYLAGGEFYPLINIIVLVVTGLISIIAGCKMKGAL